MRIVININTENSAFDNNKEEEVKRVVKGAIDSFYSKNLFDINGNNVGDIDFYLDEGE